MNKDELLKLTEELFREAFDANSYFLIMQQYGKYSAKYKAEIALSPAFYNIVFNALQVACFMELAKLYAHNDSGRLLGEDISTQAPIHYSDIQELIDFALNATQLIIACLTDIYKVEQYTNINDWEGTLMLAQLGLKYQDYDLECQMKEFEKQLRFQTTE